MINRLKTFLITGLGTGFLKPAPGTWGSAAACGVIWLLWWAGGFCPYGLPIIAALVAILSTLGCLALGKYAEKRFGKKDPGQCTLDEFAGQALAILAIPLTANPEAAWIPMICCFLAFRFFDIVKPPPANGLERLKGGWGIVADDLIAGLYAAVFTRFVFLPVIYYFLSLLNIETGCSVLTCG